MNSEITTELPEIFSSERILYKDNYLAVFNKVAGEISEAWNTSCKEEKHLYVTESFKKCLNDEHSVPEFCQCFNRLDRPVSGANILIFDKNLFALLQNQFTNNQKNIKKMYWAIVEGIYPTMDDVQILEHFLRFDARKQKAFVFDKEERKTKKASLAWKSLGHGENYSFVEIKLITGRTHQIRAQLAHIGLHIKGDVKYGARRQDTLPGIRLHAHSIEFMHPKTKEIVSVVAPLPTIDPLWNAFQDCYL